MDSVEGSVTSRVSRAITCILLATAMCIGVTRVAVAQSPRIPAMLPTVQVSVYGASGAPGSVDSRTLHYSIQHTHWLEGGLIGGVVFGAGVYALSSALCDADSGGGCRQSQVVAVSLVSAGAGFVIGALIGGAIPKPTP